MAAWSPAQGRRGQCWACRPRPPRPPEREDPPMNPEHEFVARDTSAHPPAFTPIYKTSVFRSPRLPLWSLQNSLSEVTGPVFGQSELGPLDNDLVLNYARE